MLHIINRIMNSAISVCVSIGIAVTGLYAGYALWDNNSIYTAATNVQSDMIRLKPSVEEDEEGPSFEDLMCVNDDVCGWITLDNTNIDYPILQGESNLTYINTDVYGNFALAGSIFLDSRCDREFLSDYQLLYGHHMDKHSMFGDLDLYKEKDFFDDNPTGVLIVPGRIYELEIIACMVENASTDEIFEPEKWSENIDGLLEYVLKSGNALHVRQDLLLQLMDTSKEPGTDEAERVQILAMSTCSSEFSDARTVLLAAMSLKDNMTNIGEDVQK